MLPKFLLRTIWVVGLFWVGIAAQPVQAASSPELVLYLDASVSVSETARTLNDIVPSTIYEESLLHALRISITDAAATGNLLAALGHIRGISRVEPNAPVTVADVKVQGVPNDSQFPSQAGLSKIGAANGWEYTKGSSSVIVAVVDTGVNGTHEDLSGRVMAGRNELTASAISAATDSDDNGHGTEVSGVIGANGNNGLGIAGTDWGSRIMPVKVLDSDGNGVATDLANGIRFAADNGAKVMNLSLGSTSDITAVRQAIEYALAKGVVIVAASGNTGGSVVYPARYAGVMGVGSVDVNDSISSFSNRGPELSLVAPGENIFTTRDTSSGISYIAISGTSVATSFVSGTASMILARHPGKSSQDVKDAIIQGVDKVAGLAGNNRNDSYGYGRVNLERSLAILTDYHAQFSGQSRYPTIVAGQSENLAVRLLNSGKTSWNRSTPQPVRLGTSHGRDRVSQFIREDVVTHAPSGWIDVSRVELTTNQVDPGQIGTFSFWMSVPPGTEPGTYREYFQPVADDVTWMEDPGLYWDVTVPPLIDQYKAAWGGQNGTVTPTPGTSSQLTLTLVNTGTTTWSQSTMHLGTSHDQDRISSFIREGNGPSGWTSPNRIIMQESSVAPGGLGHFTFWMKTPNNMSPGTYREYFQPVVDGVGWMNDLGIYWDVTVPTPPPAYQSVWGGQSGNVTLVAGQAAQFTVGLKNTGGTTWNQSVVHLGTSHNQDRISSFIREGDGPSGWVSPNRVVMQESSVAPGEVGHFVFWMKVPVGLASGTYREYFQPVADGVGWMNDLGIYWDITIQ